MGAEAGVEPANRGPEPREFPLFYSASEVMTDDSALCPPSVLSIVDSGQSVNPLNALCEPVQTP